MANGSDLSQGRLTGARPEDRLEITRLGHDHDSSVFHRPANWSGPWWCTVPVIPWRSQTFFIYSLQRSQPRIVRSGSETSLLSESNECSSSLLSLFLLEFKVVYFVYSQTYFCRSLEHRNNLRVSGFLIHEILEHYYFKCSCRLIGLVLFSLTKAT